MNLQLFPSKFIGPPSARCSHKEHDEILKKKARAIVYSLPLAARETEDTRPVFDRLFYSKIAAGNCL
jgi:hypothetical protein